MKASTMANKELSYEEYCEALRSSWAVEMQEDQWFVPSINEWVQKKCTELGVPFPYVAYPLITSIAYGLGTSHVKLSETWTEPVILYTLVSGRSGTNKSGSLSSVGKIIESIFDQPEKRDIHQVTYDTGSHEGLMTTLLENNGRLLCTADEFSIFLDNLDKNTKGNAEKSRFLSLWSGASWKKNTKHGGLEELIDPRFHFSGFNQNFFLIDMLKKGSHYDGFLPRFIIATPQEVEVKLATKINAGNTNDTIKMDSVIKIIIDTFYDHGCEFTLSETAMAMYGEYHDNEVLAKRKADPFEETKCAVLSKSNGNVLRVAAVQCALRYAIKELDTSELNMNYSILDDDHVHEVEKPTTLIINQCDMKSAIVMVTYSFNCVSTIINSTHKAQTKRRRTSYDAMPSVTAIDKEFLVMHRKKVQKLWTNRCKATNKVSIKLAIRNHWYPQINNNNSASNGEKFIAGLEANGLGKIDETNENFIFINLVDKENFNNDMVAFITDLGLS